MDSVRIRDLEDVIRSAAVVKSHLELISSTIRYLKQLHQRMEDRRNSTSFGVRRRWQFLRIEFEFENLLEQNRGLLSTWDFMLGISQGVRNSVCLSACNRHCLGREI